MLITDHTKTPAGDPSGHQGPLAMFWWQGYSSRFHLTSVYPLDALDCRERGAFVLVRREADGSATPLMVGMADNVADDLFDVHGEATLRAVRAGATEAHVHLASDHSWQHAEVIHDIAVGWQMAIERVPVYA